MKACPVCQARTFDDAPVCYGCLHRYDDGEGVDGEEPLGAVALPPQEFRIRLTPSKDQLGTLTWTCAVETLRGEKLA